MCICTLAAEAGLDVATEYHVGSSPPGSVEKAYTKRNYDRNYFSATSGMVGGRGEIIMGV